MVVHAFFATLLAMTPRREGTLSSAQSLKRYMAK
jgi:hypothetical protein